MANAQETLEGVASDTKNLFATQHQFNHAQYSGDTGLWSFDVNHAYYTARFGLAAGTALTGRNLYVHVPKPEAESNAQTDEPFVFPAGHRFTSAWIVYSVTSSHDLLMDNNQGSQISTFLVKTAGTAMSIISSIENPVNSPNEFFFTTDATAGHWQFFFKYIKLVTAS